MHSKTFVLFIGLLSIAGCGPSAKEKEEMTYDTGYSDGYRQGFTEALKCVEHEGGEAEDAADHCEGRM